MSHTMTFVPQKHRASFRERVSRALEAVRSYTITNLLSGDKKTAEMFGFGSRTDAGIVVTARNAFTFSAVFDAVNQGSSDLAKLPLNLLKQRQGGGTEHHTESRTYRLLKHEPNPEMSAMDFRQTVQAHAMTRTGGFAEIERDGAGRPYWLWPITPDRVERKRDQLRGGGYGPLYYLIDGTDVIPARDMLDIRGLGYDGSSGYDVIDKARQAIGLALAAEKFGASFFGDGASFPGLLSIKNAVGPDSMDKFREHIDQQYGRGSWNRFLVLDNDPSFTSFGIEPQKAQMNELRTKQVEEVARFFNFPVHKLKNLDRATNNNIEQQDLEYYKGFQLNWTTKWEQECNRKLIPSLESRQQFFKHNVNAFLRGDTAARTAFYTAMLDRGVFNADMVLELEDMNPQPDGLGKMYLVQGAMVPKDKIREIAEKQVQPPQPPPSPDDNGVTQEDVDAADARAIEAERVAAEMRASAEAAEQRATAMEATATATAAQLTEAQSTATAESTRAVTAEAIAAQLRSDAETAQAQFEAAEAERARLAGEIETERTRVQAVEANLATAVADADQLRQSAADTFVRLSTVEAERTADAEQQAAALAASQARVAELEQQLAEARQAIEPAESQVTSLAADLETARSAERELRLAQESSASAHQHAVSTLEDALTTSRLRAESAEARVEQAQRELEAARTSRHGRISAEIAAHRALVVDIMRRMIEREADRAQRHHATPEKLRTWLDSFYSAHEDLMRTALLPAVRIHLAWTGSAEDPVDTAARLARRHVEESQRQVRLVLDGDADDLATSLPALLHRWETTRVAVIADDLMQKELDHVRER